MTQNKQTLLDEKQTPEGYKKTEFGNIPADWSVLCLGELGKFKNGINKDANQFGFGKPFVNLMDVFGKLSIDKTVSFELINSTELDRKEYSLNRGDVLFIRSSVKPSGVGLTAVITDNLLETVFSGFLIRFRSDGNLLDLGFKKYCFNANYFRKQVISNSTVSANTNINQEVLKKLELIFPKKLEEQQKIATALSDIDALISELEKLIEKKQAIKTATMQQLLTGKTRLPEFALREDGTLKAYKDSELGQIPEDWEVKKIGEFTDCTAGGTPSTSVKSYWGGQHPWMSSGELHLKRVLDVKERITDAGLKYSSTKYIPSDSVLMGLAGQGKTRGTVAISKIKLCTNQSIASIFPSEEHNTEYLYYNLDSRYEELRGLSTGEGGRGGLNLSIIRKLVIPFPSLNEQNMIVQVLSDLDRELEQISIKLAKLNKIKQGMMQELLTGKTRLV